MKSLAHSSYAAYSQPIKDGFSSLLTAICLVIRPQQFVEDSLIEKQIMLAEAGLDRKQVLRVLLVMPDIVPPPLLQKTGLRIQELM